MAERVVLRGTRSSNVLDVSSELQPYEIYALKGNDRVVGTAFDDLIDGGTGHDDLFGGAGNDTFTVSGSTNGDDLFDGGDGHDVVVGSDGDDRIHMRRLTVGQSIDRRPRRLQHGGRHRHQQLPGFQPIGRANV